MAAPLAFAVETVDLFSVFPSKPHETIGRSNAPKTTDSGTAQRPNVHNFKRGRINSRHKAIVGFFERIVGDRNFFARCERVQSLSKVQMPESIPVFRELTLNSIQNLLGDDHGSEALITRNHWF